MMKKFWDLLGQSVITQGIVTVTVIGTVCYVTATGGTVPNELWSISTLILGFYFGAKVQVGIERARSR